MLGEYIIKHDTFLDLSNGITERIMLIFGFAMEFCVFSSHK
jgi:hypothetical protein